MVGNIPAEKKYVIVVAPHTSNWDFVIGQLYYWANGMKAKVMIKKELFYFPLGILLRSFGGIPVDRHRKTDIVEQVIKKFNKNESFIITLTPEGTRDKVSEWKSGFFRIAKGANVPLLPGFFDYKKKIIGTGDLYYLSDNLEAEMIKLKKFYKDFSPKYPSKFSVGDIG